MSTVTMLIRKVCLLLYYSLCVGFVVTVAFSVTYGAFRPTAGQGGEAPASVRPDDGDGQQCFADLGLMLDSLHTEASSSFTEFLNTKSLERWSAFSERWRDDLANLSARCHLKTSAAMAPMREYAKDIERVHRAYDTSLQSYSERLKRSATRLQKNRAVLSGQPE